MDYSLPGSSVRGILLQEYWSGFPFPLAGDLPHSGIKPASLTSLALASKFFTTSATRETLINQCWTLLCSVLNQYQCWTLLNFTNVIIGLWMTEMWYLRSLPWQIDGETVADFILGGSRITAGGDCSHEIKRCLLLGRKVMTNLDSILKSRDITLSTKVHLVKAMVFPVVMYGCESWTIKKTEHRRIDAFELWCWRRFLRVPWTARRSNQSILKEISPGCSLEGLMFKLKLQYSGHLMWRVDLFEKTLMLGKLRAGGEGDDRRWDGWMASPTQWIWIWVDSGSWWWTGRPDVLQFMGSQRVGHEWATELNWTEDPFQVKILLFYYMSLVSLKFFSFR